MFGGLDPEKLLVILLVGIVVVGPERLPRVARQIGAFWHDLARMRERLESEVREALPDLDLPSLPALPKRGLTGYLTSLMTAAGTGEETAEGPLPGDPVDGRAGAYDRVAVYDVEERPALPEQASVSAPAGRPAQPIALPAGWNAVGAPAPGYASGSLLAPVPSVSAAGPLGVEGEFDLDAPGWN